MLGDSFKHLLETDRARQKIAGGCPELFACWFLVNVPHEVGPCQAQASDATCPHFLSRLQAPLLLPLKLVKTKIARSLTQSQRLSEDVLMPLLTNVARLTASSRDPKLPSAVLDSVSKHLSEKGKMRHRAAGASSWVADAKARLTAGVGDLVDCQDSFDVFLHILGSCMCYSVLVTGCVVLRGFLFSSNQRFTHCNCVPQQRPGLGRTSSLDLELEWGR